MTGEPQGIQGMKARQLEPVVISGANAAALQTALATWHAAAGEKVVHSVVRVADFAVLIYFTV